MIQNKQYKRQTRKMSDQTKQKISQSLTGRKKSPTHVSNISQALKHYWSQIEDGDGENDSTNDEQDYEM